MKAPRSHVGQRTACCHSVRCHSVLGCAAACRTLLTQPLPVCLLSYCALMMTRLGVGAQLDANNAAVVARRQVGRHAQRERLGVRPPLYGQHHLPPRIVPVSSTGISVTQATPPCHSRVALQRHAQRLAKREAGVLSQHRLFLCCDSCAVNELHTTQSVQVYIPYLDQGESMQRKREGALDDVHDAFDGIGRRQQGLAIDAQDQIARLSRRTAD